MFEFDYKPEDTTVRVFGRTYSIPTKTAFFIDNSNEINKRIIASKSTIETVEATLDGIALYLGRDFVAERYGNTDTESIDTDEIGALWAFLNKASAAVTKKVLEKYAPAD